MIRLFLAWQDVKSRRWFPIGRLTVVSHRYNFSYVHGAKKAEKFGFSPLPSFKTLDQVYEAEELFPLFSNRILSKTRPDYEEFLSWLTFDADQDREPLELLGLSGGQRVTDHLEVFPMPEHIGGDDYRVRFFVHGLRHMTEEAVARVDKLHKGDRLKVVHDFQNPSDPRAMMLRSPETNDRDMHNLGYCPRYLFADSFEFMKRDQEWPRVSVEKVNPAPAPIRFRLLCRAEMRLSKERRPFEGPDFQPISGSAPPWQCVAPGCRENPKYVDVPPVGSLSRGRFESYCARHAPPKLKEGIHGILDDGELVIIEPQRLGRGR